jgi:hypothetical protein
MIFAKNCILCRFGDRCCDEPPRARAQIFDFAEGRHLLEVAFEIGSNEQRPKLFRFDQLFPESVGAPPFVC